jgi:hypothetical protein
MLYMEKKNGKVEPEYRLHALVSTTSTQVAIYFVSHWHHTEISLYILAVPFSASSLSFDDLRSDRRGCYY